MAAQDVEDPIKELTITVTRRLKVEYRPAALFGIPPMARTHAWTVVLLAILLCGCAVRRPQVGLNSVDVGTVSITGAELVVRLDIHNPNSWTIDLRTLTYQVSVDDVPLGTGETRQPLVVSGGECATLTLPIAVQWPGVGQAGRELLRGEVEYRIQGRLTVQSPIGRISHRFDRTSRFSPLQRRRGRNPLCADVRPSAPVSQASEVRRGTTPIAYRSAGSVRIGYMGSVPADWREKR